MQRGIEKGIEKGNQQTEIKKNIIGIKNMYQEGFPIEMISKIQEVNKTFVSEVISCINDFKNEDISTKTQKAIKKISAVGLSVTLIAQLFGVEKEIIALLLSK